MEIMKLVVNPLRFLRDARLSEPLVLAFSGDRLLLERTQDDAGVGLPTVSDLESLGITGRFPMDLGEVDGIPVEAWDVPELPELADGWCLEGVRSLFGIVDERLFAVMGRGAHLIHWRRTSEHCGDCGAITELAGSEFALRCPSCGLSQFPHISPSVVVLIEDGSRCLLTHESEFQTGLFTCLAGFVEPGETLEQAIHREVHEEAGLDVSDLRYFGSQPWPYPDGLMVGFHARYAGGELRKRDGELKEARWFDVSELPLLPGSFSLARQLIDDFRTRALPAVSE
jgi:NAD+ diphosphatase